MKISTIVKVLVCISVIAVLFTGCSSNNNGNGSTKAPTTGTGTTASGNGSGLKDGTYQVEDDDLHNGYRNVLEMTVSGNAITKVHWDALDEDGTGKHQLSLEGEYIMTDDGLLWSQQSDLLADYVVKNQSASGLKVDDDGKTDVISGVSIDISDFIRLVDEALAKAK